MTGIELIDIERKRQMAEERWSSEHGGEYVDGELALAAVCYATPVQLYVKDEQAMCLSFNDPWPASWDAGWDKRFSYGERKGDPRNRVPDPATYADEERLDLLVKAGALIAAEIDRLQRVDQPKATSFSQRFFFLCDLSSPAEH